MRRIGDNPVIQRCENYPKGQARNNLNDSIRIQLFGIQARPANFLNRLQPMFAPSLEYMVRISVLMALNETSSTLGVES